MKLISTKTKYVHTDSWRGYELPINAVAGANDTGNYSDSPCPSHVCTEELNRAKKILRKNNISYRTTINISSNVFCVHRYILTDPKDHKKSKELLKHLKEETRLFYIV